MTPTKKILSIRFAKQYLTTRQDYRDELENKFHKYLSEHFFVIIFWDENETNKTEFEITNT